MSQIPLDGVNLKEKTVAKKYRRQKNRIEKKYQYTTTNDTHALNPQ